MKLLPRRSADTASADSGATSADSSAAGGAADANTRADIAAGTPGKGRPTPKRRDSTVVRGPVSAPKTRKEAYARQRQQAKAQRAARQTARTSPSSMTAAQRREMLRAGDPAHLPKRDQGQTRKLTRDWVDSHRLFSNYLLLLFPLMVLSYLIPGLSLAVIVVFLGLLVEWYLVGRRMRKLSIERFGTADGGGPMTLGFYAGSRAYLPRRWRLPAPQVSRGDQI